MRRHGGDKAGYAMEYGRDPLDFSANVSPLGLPEHVRAAAAAALEDTAFYPDPECRALRGALSGRTGAPEEQILCGGGASDLIWRLALAKRPKKALVTAPSFSEYAQAVRRAGGSTESFLLKEEDGFRVTDGILDRIVPGLDRLFLCQPNNPTGVSVGQELLTEILSRCRRTGTLLALDECFIGFTQDPELLTMQRELDGGNLLIFRAFTKSYGMAGLRLGYCLSADRNLLNAMSEAGPPWAVSNVAQAAGIAALEETEYEERLRNLILRERPALKKALEDLGMHVTEGEANFLLFKSPVPLSDALKKHGILIRECGDFEGLNGEWYRTAVRTREENMRLAAAMKEVLA